MDKLKNRDKKILLGLISLSLVIIFTSCASIKDRIGVSKGRLVGNRFTIMSYDHYGEKTLTLKGSKVGVETLRENKSADEEEAKYKSSVLEITINGNQVLQVGNTLIFQEDGLSMVEDFQLAENLEAKPSAGLMAIDRNINHIKNKLGSEKVVVISTPIGVPIGVYEGKKVYATVPKDLPKMTRLNIDGKSLYIHRANYMIIDRGLID